MLVQPGPLYNPCSGVKEEEMKGEGRGGERGKGGKGKKGKG